METYKAIMERHSARSFKDKEVPFEVIGKILEAGKAAPSAGNLQNWKFIVVSKENKKHEIAEACAEQHWIGGAPFIIVVVGEPEAAKRHYGTRGERLYTIQNSAAAIENMLIMASDLGIAGCWIGAFDEGKLRHELRIPESGVIYAVLPFGYALGELEKPPEKRLELVTYFEEWGQTKKFPAADTGWNSMIMKEGLHETHANGQKLFEKIKAKVAEKLKLKKKEDNKEEKKHSGH